MELSKSLHVSDISVVKELIVFFVDLMESAVTKDSVSKTKTPMKSKLSALVESDTSTSDKDIFITELRSVLMYFEVLEIFPDFVSRQHLWRNFYGEVNFTSLLEECSFHLSSSDEVNIILLHDRLMKYCSTFVGIEGVVIEPDFFSPFSMFMQCARRLIQLPEVIEGVKLDEHVPLRARIDIVVTKIPSVLSSDEIENWIQSFYKQLERLCVGKASELPIDLNAAEILVNSLTSMHGAIDVSSICLLLNTQKIIQEYDDVLCEQTRPWITPSLSSDVYTNMERFSFLVDLSSRDTLVNFLCNILATQGRSLKTSQPPSRLLRLVLTLSRTWGISCFKTAYEMFSDRFKFPSILKFFSEDELQLWLHIMDFIIGNNLYDVIIEVLMVDLNYTDDSFPEGHAGNKFQSKLRFLAVSTDISTQARYILSLVHGMDLRESAIEEINLRVTNTETSMGAEEIDDSILIALAVVVPITSLMHKRSLLEKFALFMQSFLYKRIRLHSELATVSLHSKTMSQYSFADIVSKDRATPLPFLLTPFALINQIVHSDLKSLGAELYWSASLRPMAMLSSFSAQRRLSQDYAAQKLPFYVSKFPEVHMQDWGWSAWGTKSC